MFVSIFFSLIIYRGLIGEINRVSRMERFRSERRHSAVRLPSPVFLDPNFINEIKRRIIFGLITVNGVIFVGAGALGYFLAGKTLSPIQEMVEEQNRFISDASHELRTPLTALKSSFEVDLRDENLSIDNAKKTMSAGIEDVNNLQHLSDSLLQLSQYEKSGTYSNFEKVSLKQVINESIKKVKN